MNELTDEDRQWFEEQLRERLKSMEWRLTEQVREIVTEIRRVLETPSDSVRLRKLEEEE
jgi:hypothetical protein